MMWKIKDGREYINTDGKYAHRVLATESKFSDMLWTLSADEINGHKANDYWYAVNVDTGREITRAEAEQTLADVKKAEKREERRLRIWETAMGMRGYAGSAAQAEDRSKD